MKNTTLIIGMITLAFIVLGSLINLNTISYLIFAIAVITIMTTELLTRISDNRYYKKAMYEKRMAVDRLTNSLKLVCSQFGVPVSYKYDLGNLAGRYVCKYDGKKPVLQTFGIEILHDYKDVPWVLAHELGHYVAIKAYGDDSDRAADLEAKKLCDMILTEREQILLGEALSIYYSEPELAKI